MTPTPGELPVDVPALLAYLGEIHARQLTEANMEAAKWRAAATGAAAELGTLRARVSGLEHARDATPAPLDDPPGDT